MALGRTGLGSVFREKPNLVTHAGRANMRHPDAGNELFRKSQRRKIIALGFNHQADDCTAMNVDGPTLYQQAVDGGVKPAVVNDVVDVAVNIVVAPAGLYKTEDLVIVSFHRDRTVFLTHWHTSLLTIFDPNFKP